MFCKILSKFVSWWGDLQYFCCLKILILVCPECRNVEKFRFRALKIQEARNDANQGLVVVASNVISSFRGDSRFPKFFVR